MSSMADQQNLPELEEHLGAESGAHRSFFVPIVRAIAALGGRARKRDVVKKVRELLAGVLSEKQLDYLESNNRFGWARIGLKKNGVIGGEYGFWELTPLGRDYEQAHAAEELRIDRDIPESRVPPPSTVVTESVAVTGFGAYEIPALEVMATGVTQKRDILEELGRRLDENFLPGDKREMPSGTLVWQFRAHWSFSTLAKAGHAENVSTGQWRITDAGRERLEREREAWNITEFYGARAKVRIIDDTPPPSPSPPVLDAWTKLRARIGKSLFDQLDARLRPELGTSPDTPFPRNIILYGPPGTGKTYLAKEVARALSGQEALSEEGRFRLVQFHPSYAYEDFVQGLRPDIKQTRLRYQIHKGPFLRVAEDAAQEPDAFFVLVIDEINRGDPARIFGELLYALEYRDEPVELALGGELLVPSNLVLLGTMNSVDRSVALVDYALRRRFGFVRVDPDSSVISDNRGEGILADLGPSVLDRFNAWLTKRLDREHAIGHSFFLSPSLPDDADDAFERLWRLDVGPLLEEYFFGDLDSFEEAARQWREIVAEARRTRDEVRADEQTEAAG